MYRSTSRLANFLHNTTRQLRLMSTNISITPQFGLIDDPLNIQVFGLEAGQNVTLQTFLQDHKFKFISCGQYRADDSGRVNVSEHASAGGCYEGVESTGLIWSMCQAPGQRDGLRLMKRDATVPYDVHLFVHDGHINVEDCYEKQNSDNGIIARTIFNRTYMHPDVTRRPVREGRLRGALYTPPGPGPFPVVIDLFGTAGGLLETRAALLASRGFQVLPLAYFAYEDLEPFLSEINLDYFEEAVDYLMSLPTYNGHGVGVVGVSKGGEIALMMAEKMSPKVKAIVSINGLYFRSTTPFTYKSQDLPIFVPDYGKAKIADGALHLLDCFDPTEVSDESIIRVEESDSEMLIITSGDDGQCPAWTTEFCAKRLRDHGRTNFEYVCYPKSGHLLEAPHSPFCRMSYHSKFLCNLLWGGEMVPHTRAQEQSWPKILNFLAKNLGGALPSSKL